MRSTALKGSILAAVLTGVLAMAPAASAGRYDDRVRCNSKTVKRANVVARSSEAAVFTKRSLIPGTGIYRYRSYACMFRRGPISYLQRSDTTRSQLGSKLAGRFVGFRQFYGITEFGSESGLVVLDMRTGDVVLEGPPRADGTNLASFVVKRNGSAAWISVPEEPGDTVVWKAEATNVFEREQLEAATDIDTRALRLSADRRTITWTRGGTSRSAPLD